MPKSDKSEKVPKAMQNTFDGIAALTDAFCDEYLNEEYAHLARCVVAALCRKRPSPLLRGESRGWACGIIYALGQVNFLFDRNNLPYMSPVQLCDGFGVSKGTASTKARQVRNALKMIQMDPHWCLPSLLDRNPLAWMIAVNGLPMDARVLPREIQEIAYEKGLIPYVPNSESIGPE